MSRIMYFETRTTFPYWPQFNLDKLLHKYKCLYIHIPTANHFVYLDLKLYLNILIYYYLTRIHLKPKERK